MLTPDEYYDERFTFYRARGEDMGNSCEWADAEAIAYEARLKLKDEPCSHEWVAGMMVVNEEDLEQVAVSRPVKCDKCDHVAAKGVDY